MLETDNIQLSPNQQAILNELENYESHIFLSGRAGTGKSTIVNLFKRHTKKNVVVLAPTGIAALNIGGQTIHSFFRFPPKLLIDKEFRKRRNRKVYEVIDTIVIDEVSMLRADLLDAIDRFLQLNRENFNPFGGVQMIFIGDLFQLPPVVPYGPEGKYLKMNYDSEYFFSAQVIQNSISILFLELDEVFRQKNRRFISFLSRIRNGDVDRDDLEMLNSRHNVEFESMDEVITLCSTNAIANNINSKKLKELKSQSEFKNAKIKGKFPSGLYPVKENMQLKVGAQVMMVRNDPKGIYVNGTIGKIHSIGKNSIEISSQQTKESPFKVKPIEWEISKFIAEEKNGEPTLSSETIGHFKQFPLKLAWAVTIHKSQGQTYDKLVLDLGRGAFAHGQTYVALSRARSFEGISLKNPMKPRDIILDPRIIEFYETCRRYN